MSARWERCREDQGAMTIAFGLVLTLLTMSVGVLYDAGVRLNGLGQASDLASNSSRAGGQELAGRGSDGRLRLDPAAAETAAETYLSRAALTDAHIVGSSVTVRGDTVEVTVTLSVPRRFPPGSTTVSATQRSTAVEDPGLGGP